MLRQLHLMVWLNGHFLGWAMGMVGTWGPGTETGYPQQPTGTSPSSHPPQELGLWLVRGPFWGQLCGPRRRGLAVCLLKEGKQPSGLLIQPHLGAPGSAASVCPGCPAQITQDGGPGTSQGVALAPQPRQGWRAVAKMPRKEPWALPL